MLGRPVYQAAWREVYAVTRPAILPEQLCCRSHASPLKTIPFVIRRSSFPPSPSLLFVFSMRAHPVSSSSLRTRLIQKPDPSMMRTYSKSPSEQSSLKPGKPPNDEAMISHTESRHEHEHENDHEHSHSHSIFGSHSHGEEDHDHGTEKVIEALQGAGDRGSRITLVGLFSNIVLTAAKGAAGVYMHSASLLADAGHSLSDLLGDFVTLFCWKLSRKPPSERYPYGFAKFETLGTTTVSLLLIGGALGIGFHSYHLLMQALSETAATMAPGAMQQFLHSMTSLANHVPAVGHAHVHVLDPNAAWFAAVSVVAKEWLYRATKKVAEEENSPVLYANAIHHRSDAYSSVVALFAILGNWIFPALPLDPLGGLLVAVVILQQGWGIFIGSWSQLTDAGVSPRTHRILLRTLDPLLVSSVVPSAESTLSPISANQIHSIRHLRAKRAGALMFVDLTADVTSVLTVKDASTLEKKIEDTLKKAKKEIAEVRVRFHPVGEKS